MRPVSQISAEALAGTHGAGFRLDLLDVASGSVLLADVPLIGGRLAGSLLTPHRWSLDADIPDLDLAPRSADDPLSGLALAYARLSYEIRSTTAGTVETVPLCRLLIDGTEITRDAETADRRLTMRAVSPSQWIADAGIVEGLQPTPGETLSSLISRIALDALPYEIPYLFDADPTISAPEALTATGDPWQAIERLADTADLVAYTDALGILTVAPPARVGGEALPITVAGTITGTSAGVGRAFYNRARVTFSDPILGDVIADERITAGPLRWDGPAGRRLYQETRPGPVSQTRADVYAASLLATGGYGVRATYVTAAPDPRIVPGDNVLITYQSGAVERSLVTSVDLPLGNGEAMTLGVRGNG